jgi:hypothetical protein
MKKIEELVEKLQRWTSSCQPPFKKIIFIFISLLECFSINLFITKKKHYEKTQKPLNANSFFLRVNGSFYCSLKSENTKKLLKPSLKKIYLLRMIKSFYYTDKI